jgi:TatD DNase family protein
MRLFDTHTHLQLSQFDGDRAAALDRAQDAGLVGLLVLGVDVASSEDAIALADAEAGVHAAAGCHPHDAAKLNEGGLEQLAELAKHPRVLAVGEIGLDFYRNFSPREQQLDVFGRQLATAAEVAKPIAVHCRDAQDDLFPLIEAWSNRLGRRLPDGRPLGVMHYFSGDAELAKRYVELGFLISVHSSVTYPKAQQLQDVAQRLPLDALVVETDSPYGAPQSRRGERNEPAFVAEAVAKIAELRGDPVERIAESTTENALRLFGLDVTPPVAPAAQSGQGA